VKAHCCRESAVRNENESETSRLARGMARSIAARMARGMAREKKNSAMVIIWRQRCSALAVDSCYRANLKSPSFIYDG
jgi:hypothetical protein